MFSSLLSIVLAGYIFLGYSGHTESFSECIEVPLEIRASIPEHFAPYILENHQCLPSDVYLDVWSYIFFLNEYGEKIYNFSALKDP